jgi:hypothetical protein
MDEIDPGRMFFHYSHFSGNQNELRINDEVEFEMMIDERNGRPVATHITKLQTGTIIFEIYSNERIMGEVKQFFSSININIIL